jgi:DNA-binding GntR family transcriptional regulator
MTATRPDSPGPVRDSVREAIRALVLAGELRPGDRLVERQLAERLGVSRVPVREALRQLAHEGLAEERSTRGMVVRRLDDEDVEALFEVRGALEEIVCRRIVAHAADRELDRLDATVEQSRAALARSDPRAAVAANAAFHEVLTELAGSPVLVAVMEPVAGRMRWLLSQHDDPAAIADDHAALARALRDRDATAAARVCRAHLAASRAAADAAR